jgi:hypothetical protein
MTYTSLSERLAVLRKELQRAEDWVSTRGLINAEHTATNLELRTRYEALVERVGKEEAAAESHGAHVSDLEHAVRLWLDRLDRDAT